MMSRRITSSIQTDSMSLRNFHNKPWQFVPAGAGLATLAAAQGRYELPRMRSL